VNALADPSWGKEVFLDAKWAEQYERKVISIAIGEMFCRVSTLKEDQHEATDFVTQSSNAKWASRIRRLRSAARYRDVTIRSQRPSGTKTELGKHGAPKGNQNASKNKSDGNKDCNARFVYDYFIARLRKENLLDLAAKVESKELSANAAAIEAGFRKKPTPYDELCRAWKKASSKEKTAFRKLIA